MTQIALPRYTESPEFETDYDLNDLFARAFRTDQTIGSAISQVSGMPDYRVDDPEFNPWTHLTPEERADADFVDYVSLADSVDEIDAVREQVAREREDRRILSDAGAEGVFASMAMGILDPINFIPVGGTAYKTYRTGGSILKSAAVTGSVAAGSTALQESALHYTQLERTFGESAVNVSAAALLGFTLSGTAGGLSKYFSTREADRILAEIEQSLDPEAAIAAGGDSVGAARVMDDILIKGKVARTLAKVLAIDPLSRTLTSPSEVTRQVAARLAESPFAFEGGTPFRAAETLIKIHDGKLAQAMEEHLVQFKAYRQRTGEGMLQGITNRGDNMSRTRFNELVSREIRNPGSTDIPEIQSAARAWENKLYKPMTKEAIDARLLGEDLDPVTAQGYLNRMWNPNKINANLSEFVRITARWLEDTNPNAGIDYEDLARQIARTISSSADGRLPYDYKLGESKGASGKSELKGNFKSRTFLIPDELVEQFLENDIELLGARYLKAVAPDIELKKAFDDVELKSEINDIADWYGNKIESLSAEGKHKEADRLAKKREKDIRDIAAMRDRMRGIYEMGDPDALSTRAFRAARDLNYMRLMGGVVPASIPDTGRIIMAEGIVDTFGKGLVPLMRNIQSFKIAAKEGKAYGIGTDVIMGGRSEIIADVADYAKGGTMVERGLRSMSQSFGKINLMNRWTAGMKQMHLVVMQNKLVPMLRRGQYDERLKHLGITRDDALNMRSELQNHGEQIDGVWIANSKSWDSPELAEMWGAALRKESDRVIIMPGQEKPLFMSSEMGKTVFQFKSFMTSATQRILISGLQGADAHYMQGVVSLVSLGMLSYVFKQWDAGRDITDDPMELVIEGIDRSGALGMLMEMNNTIEKISASNIGIRPLLGTTAPASRYASRSATEAFMGPTFGSLLDTTFRVLGAGNDGEWTEKDTRALRRLLPYQNLAILRQGFDKIEKSLGD